MARAPLIHNSAASAAAAAAAVMQSAINSDTDGRLHRVADPYGAMGGNRPPSRRGLENIFERKWK